VNAIVNEAVRFSRQKSGSRRRGRAGLRSDLPLLSFDRDQIKQAFYNGSKTAFEAMKRRGILRIRTDMDDARTSHPFLSRPARHVPENLEPPRFDLISQEIVVRTGLGLFNVAPHRARTWRRIVDRKAAKAKASR